MESTLPACNYNHINLVHATNSANVVAMAVILTITVVIIHFQSTGFFKRGFCSIYVRPLVVILTDTISP